MGWVQPRYAEEVAGLENLDDDRFLVWVPYLEGHSSRGDQEEIHRRLVLPEQNLTFFIASLVDEVREEPKMQLISFQVSTETIKVFWWAMTSSDTV